MMPSSIEIALQETAEALHETMEALLPELKGNPEDRIYEAMRYSALAPGKRLRPFLLIKTSEIFGVSRLSALRAAAAVEFVHAYSLIHDDLPCIDNDDFRRGLPSCHKQFDEATAVLAGDGLQALAFEVLSDPQTHNSAAVRCELVRILAKAAGCRGMVGGQMIDILSDTLELDEHQVTHLQRLKTGALFSVSCESGGVLGNASLHLRNMLRCYANDIGAVFQVTDDIMDAESADHQDSGRVNKSAKKPTLVGLLGAERVRTHCRMLIEQATGHLRVFGGKSDILRELAEYIGERAGC